MTFCDSVSITVAVLPPSAAKNRTSFVLTIPPGDFEQQLAAARAAGGRLLDSARVADPEDNELVMATG